MIRLGVIGVGTRLSAMIKVANELFPDEIKIAGVIDPDEKGAREKLPEKDRQDATFYGAVDEMARKGKLDGVMIGTRCNLHTPYAIELSRYDMPLFLEKPVAVNMEQAQAMEKAFSDSKCQVVVSFPLRVSSLCLKAKEYIDRGDTGRPEHVMASNYVSYGTVYWKDAGYRNYAITQGLFLQKATHDFNYMEYLMGSRIIRVAAMANFRRVFGTGKPADRKCATCPEAATCLESPQWRRRHNAYFGWEDKGDIHCVFSSDGGPGETETNEDCSSALMEFASGAHGVYTQVFFVRRGAGTRGATISGYKGTVGFDWYTGEIKIAPNHSTFAETARSTQTGGHFGGDQALMFDFIGVIKGECCPRTPIAEGVSSVYACLAAKKSLETGQFEEVRQVAML